MGLLDVIKEAGAGAVEEGNPVAVIFGIVEKKSPLEVRLSQTLTLTEDFFVFTEDAGRKILEQGDKLILLRVQGGQSYVVLDRVM